MYDEEWGADEELLLLEGAEIYGLGSWSDISDHIGGYRTKDEVRDHYLETYVESSKFPLPENADPGDKRLAEDVPRETFQARKKRRIDERKEAAKTATPAVPKQKPTASVPACHEVQGYMPGRLEFETEFANEAEEAVQHMQFDPGDGVNPETGELEPEMELKMIVMNIYNSRLTLRIDRKKVVFEHNLLEYKKNMNIEKKKTKEEKLLFDKTKPFTRLMNHDDYIDFSSSINEEHNLRQAIAQLQDWRRMGIGDLRMGEKYESERQVRMQRPPPTGAFDRQGGVRATEKKTEVKSVPDGLIELTSAELPERLRPVIPAPITSAGSGSGLTNGSKAPTTNGHTNGSSANADKTVPTAKYKPVGTGVSPLKLTSEKTPDLQIISKEEAELCSVLRIQPKPYMVIKEAVLKEAMKSGGQMKRKGFKDICKVRQTKFFWQ